MNRELDLKIAEAMGWWWHSYPPENGDGRVLVYPDFKMPPNIFGRDLCWVPCYQEEICEAWKLVEEMGKLGNISVELNSCGIWSCGWFKHNGDPSKGIYEVGDTAAEVICKVYLKWQERKGNV